MTRRSLEQRAAIVQQWHASGLSAPAFAKLHGFSLTNLSRWAARFPPPSPPTQPTVSFVRLQQTPRDSSLTVEVGRARVLVAPGFDPALLRSVVAALAEAS